MKHITDIPGVGAKAVGVPVPPGPGPVIPETPQVIQLLSRIATDISGLKPYVDSKVAESDTRTDAKIAASETRTDAKIAASEARTAAEIESLRAALTQLRLDIASFNAIMP